MKKIIYLVLVLFILSPFSHAENAEQVNIEKMSTQVKKIKRKLSRGQFEHEDLSVWTKLTIKMKVAASSCVSNKQTALADLKTAMEGLGEKVKGEDPEVTRKRHKYEKQKQELDKALAKCNLYIVTAEEVEKKIDHAEKSYYRQKYLIRSSNVIELFSQYFSSPVSILEDSGDFIFNHSGISEIDKQDLAISLLAVFVSIFAGFWLRKKLLILESGRTWGEGFSENLIRALLTTLAHFIPYLLAASIAAASMVIFISEVEETPFITQLFFALLVFLSVSALIRCIFSPPPPAKLFISFTPHIAESLARQLKFLAILSLLGYLAFYTIFSESIVESNLLLLRSLFALIFIVNVIWILRIIIRSPRLPKLRYISLLVVVLLIASLIAEWMGYRNLAFASRKVVLLVFVMFMLLVGISRLFRDLFNAIDDGKYAWCRYVRHSLGVEDNKKVPGLIWVRFLTTMLLWGSFVLVLINVLDFTGGTLQYLQSYLVNGFDVGDFRIVPGKILWAFLIFGMMLAFSGWLRSQLENNWLKMTSMAQGARDAVVTITGYLMFLLAIIIGLSTAGFDFGNIAIIAGALSVGIGFGLQNIVNNFVSGLVILFERPIRKGDWISVGTTEGIVKDIQIRATRIQTFDRSDVIVPNSELISNQVTNWVLSSQTGRAIIPVGVAYGSDTEKVRDILQSIAEKNEHVVKSGFAPKPLVLFREFGDSSLNFELRVFLYDVDSRLSVISEINFEIDRMFKQEGIKIPFPQRDLHVKSMPDNSPEK